MLWVTPCRLPRDGRLAGRGCELSTLSATLAAVAGLESESP